MTGIAAAVTADEKREALELALHSRTLARAEQLRTILRYLVEEDLAGRAGEITEHLIGVEVLGRPANYSPAEDSSVRTRAYELRQKLEKLYQMEARDAPVQIVLPKGTYAPQYTKRAETRVEVVTPAAVAAKPEPVAGPRRWQWALAGLAGLLLGVLATWVAFTASGNAAVDPILAEAWGPLAAKDANVVLCVATPLHLTVGPASHTRLGAPAYPAPAEAYAEFRQHRPLQPDEKLGLLITDNVIGVGTMNAVVASVNVLRTFGARWQVLPERVSPISSLRGRNAIVFGAPVDSEASTKLLEKTPLTVAYDEGVKEFVILDRTTGQKLVPRKDARGEFTEVYGLVTVLPEGDGERRQVVFAGITSTGTQGAAELFATPKSLRELKAKLGGGGFPAGYQVVVRCTFINKLLLAYEYHSHRVLL
ncbi:MAG: hypothetical protein JNK87_28270 [Bryobacterales bacterium]|nr:hypothetical protein [Bryobacterales bacterium]